MIKEITVKTALHFHEKKFATNYDLNIYRGCEHRCKYCFAQYSQKYLESDFFDDIFVKINIAEILDKELSKKSWKNDLINISGVCDCYQPLEKKYELMPKILEILIRHRNPVFILTKSTLILRDYELIKELCKYTDVTIASTITTLNEEIRQKIEPNTFSSIERIEMLERFRQINNCRTTVMLMPIIPYVTDSISEIEEIFKKSSEFRIHNLIPGSLHLRGSLKKYFFDFIKEEFPDILEKIKSLYKGSYVKKEYSNKLNRFLFQMKNKYNLYSTNNNEKFNTSKNISNNDIQMDLFQIYK